MKTLSNTATGILAQASLGVVVPTEIATILGVSVQAVNGSLAALKKHNYATYENGAIVLTEAGIEAAKPAAPAVEGELLTPEVAVIVTDGAPVEDTVEEADHSIACTALQYIHWQSEDASHVGVLTKESPKTYTFLTKYGEMCVAKDDGVFTDSTREEFEAVEVAAAPSVSHSSHGSKRPAARAIVEAGQKAGKKRKEIIADIMVALDVKEGNAGIYYNKSK